MQLASDSSKGDVNMARKVFYSFHYKADGWRVSQVRNMGVVEGSQLLNDNDWEKVKKGGDKAIQSWIDGQLSGKSCAVVLIGANTAGRRWVKYEIENAWNSNKGLVGVYIHKLQDASENQSTQGRNPFDDFTIDSGRKKLSSVVKAYNPPYQSSTYVYDYIKENIASWVEEAISIRDSV